MKNVAPLLNIEEYKNENIPSDRQIYNTLILSYDNIKNNKYKKMQDQIDNLKERVDKISNILGENELLNEKENENNKLKTVNEIVTTIANKIENNNTISNDMMNKSKLNKY